MKSVLLFLAAVAGFVTIGIVSAVVAGAMSVGSAFPVSDALKLNLNEITWQMLYSVVAYFGVCFVVAHIQLGVCYWRGVKIDNLFSQAAEYAYLILTITSLLAIVELVPNVAKLRLQYQDKLATINFQFFRREANGALQVCDEAASHQPSQDLWPKTCKWVSDASQIDEQRFSEQAWRRLEGQRQIIKRQWQVFWDAIRSNRSIDPESVPDPLTLVYPDGSRSSILAATELMKEGIQGYIENKTAEKQFKDYNLPETFFSLKLFAPFIIAFGLALRLSRATAEAAGLVAK